MSNHIPARDFRGPAAWAAALVLLWLSVSVALPAEKPEWWYPGPPGVDDPALGPFEVELDLGLGYVIPAPGSAGIATENITPGIRAEDILSRVYIYRRIEDRITVDVDFDSARRDQFGAENFFSLEYDGRDGAFVQSAAVGNRIVTTPGDDYIDLDVPPGSSLAAVVATEALVAGGTLRGAGLVQLGKSEPVTLTYAAGRQVFEVDVTDTGHIRHKHFFLPDQSDSGSLEVFRSSTTGTLSLDGQLFERLAPPDDFSFDPSSGLLSLVSSVRDRDLVVTYTAGGLRVGDPTLGINATINPAGVREDFSVVSHPASFGETGGTRYLYLNRRSENSYWEHRGAYSVGRSTANGDLRLVSVTLVESGTGQLNANYSGILDSTRLDPSLGILFFEPTDAVGFYPRPFPGIYPFTHPTTPGNPFDLDNPVYGAFDGSSQSGSINTLRIQIESESDQYVIEDLFLDGSVSVSVDGRELDSSRFSVDRSTGIVTVDDLSPSGVVTIRYRRISDDLSPPVTGSATADWERNGLSLHVMGAAEVPVFEEGLPQLGEESPSSITGSGRAVWTLSSDDESFVRTELRGAARVLNMNRDGRALIAGLGDDTGLRLSLQASDWILASVSPFLPALPSPVDLVLRGPVLFTDYTSDALIGERLQPLSWEPSAEDSFDYTAKSGPYNAADATPEGDAQSLIIDYEFEALSPDQFISIATGDLGGLGGYDTLEMIVRADAITGQAVNLFVEVLRTYDEDLDGDAAIDGEASIDDAGFVITPIAGTPTRIGSDRMGESNGKLDSEDINRNGVLDPGPGGVESGVVITGDTDHVATFSADEAWQTVRVDLRPLIEADPFVFEDASAVRLTVVPSAAPAVVSTGRVVINSIRFLTSGLSTSPDNRLTLELQHRDVLAAPNPTATDEGGDLVRVKLTSTLPADERTAVIRSLGGNRDLASYDHLVFPLYVEDPGSWPGGLSVDIRFLSTPADYVSAAVAPESLSAGWNNVRVATADLTVAINDGPPDPLSPIGQFASLGSVSAVEIGLSAGGADVTDQVEFWTDDWVAEGSTIRFGAAGGAAIEAEYLGSLSLGGFPVLSEPRFRVEYDYSSLDAAADANHAVSAESSIRLVSIMPVTLGGAWSTVPSSGDYRGSLEGTVGVGTSPGWVPTVVHSYRFAASEDNRITLNGTEYDLNSYQNQSVTVGLREEGFLPLAGRHVLEGLRTVTGTALINRDSAAPLIIESEARLEDLLKGTVELRTRDETRSQTVLSGSFNRRYSGEQAFDLGNPASAYAALLSGLFKPLAATIPNPERTHERLQFELNSVPDPEAGVGVRVNTSAAITQSGFNGDARNVGGTMSGTLAVPIGMGTENAVVVTPQLSRTAGISLVSVGEPLVQWFTATGAAALAAPFRVPLVYTTPFPAAGRGRELQALDAVIGSIPDPFKPLVHVETTAGLDVKLSSTQWYLPSLIRLELDGRTSAGASAAQDRSVLARVTKSSAIIDPGRGAGSLSAAAETSFSRDHAVDTEVFELGLDSYYAFSSVSGRGWQFNQSTRWTRERQDQAAPRLAMYPDDPTREPDPPDRPDLDRISGLLSLKYLWRSARIPSTTPRFVRRLLLEELPAQITNRESASVDVSTTIADPNSLGTTIQVPLRLTFRHETEAIRGETLSFRISMEAQGGVEKHVTTGIVDLVPSFGLEVHAGAVIRY